MSDPLRVEMPPLARPADWTGDPAKDVGEPGQFPFTRGAYAEMYSRRPWTMRQYAGFGTAGETNARFKALLAAGQTGLSTAFDLPTQMGYDSDHPMAAGEVGRVGVAIDTVEDLKALFADIPLDRVTTSMTINATAAILLAMYVVAGEEQGVSRRQLGGTVQNDVLKEYIARGTYIYPATPSLRLVTEIFRFVAEEGMNFNPISVSGYHMREAGATAVQEVAFTLANALEYVRRGIDAGVPLAAFGPRLSFFFAAHNDLLEEVAKFRAARRLYARLMRERFGADDASARLRFHTQTGGVTLQAQQPLNNVVRVAIQALAAVLGGTQSLHTNSFDEALALPTEDAVRIALRTQQVIAHETGAVNTIDPLGGSYYVEDLTNRLEAEAYDYFDRIEKLGGVIPAIKENFFQREIADASFRYQHEVEQKQRIIVGVNRYELEDEPEVEILRIDPALERKQIQRVQALRGRRDSITVETALARLKQAAARDDDNLMPPLVEASKAYVTLGEMCEALREVWGTWTETPVF